MTSAGSASFVLCYAVVAPTGNVDVSSRCTRMSECADVCATSGAQGGQRTRQSLALFKVMKLERRSSAIDYRANLVKHACKAHNEHSTGHVQTYGILDICKTCTGSIGNFAAND